MSFNQDVKKEIIILERERYFKFSLLAGFLRLGSLVNLLGKNKIRLTAHSYNPSIARFIKKELKDLFSIESELQINKNALNKYYYNLKLKADNNYLKILYKYICILDDDDKFHNLFMTKTPSFIKSSKNSIKGYLTGLFLAKGVILDPIKTYRYSIENMNKKNAEDIKKLFEKLNLSIRISIKKNKSSYNIVCTNSENILDILAFMGVSNSYTALENIIIQKQNKTIANRQRNIEYGNIEKISKTAEKQIKNILLIKEKMGLDFLPEKLKELSLKRLKNEGLSLSELSDLDNISKHTIYSRFKKIEEIAGKINNG
ncbi:MAG: DNA-binding protein WhiA [Clostridiales Family XIII bacterium]|jgi:DNA-binding protein WhiA|nr:DNA-binding protein WhiA [Clostridiales Family XIII bacterium]